MALTPILTTARLELRPVALADAAFFLRLLNEPSWLENIGDRGVRSVADAERYISTKIWAPFETHGYGMYAVQLQSSAQPIGICGLLKRDFLAGPDLGFALLPEFAGCGYAAEAARAVMWHARHTLGIERLFAIVRRGNHRSAKLLGHLGFRRQAEAIAQDPAVELYVTT